MSHGLVPAQVSSRIKAKQFQPACTHKPRTQQAFLAPACPPRSPITPASQLLNTQPPMCGGRGPQARVGALLPNKSRAVHHKGGWRWNQTHAQKKGISYQRARLDG